MSDFSPSFDQPVRVRSLAGCDRTRQFMYCEQRPEACHVHGFRHSGHVTLTGHLPEEVGLAGEVISHLGGENGGHPWIVRYDQNQAVTWPDGQILMVNSGTYAPGELEPDLSGLRIVSGAELPPLGFIGRMPRSERFTPVTMADEYQGVGGELRHRVRGKPGGGLWTSPLIEGAGPEWAAHRMARGEPWWRVNPDPQARVLVLDTAADIERARAALPHRDEIHDLLAERLEGRHGEIDFAALAGVVDAVWMTAGARHRIMMDGALDLIFYTTWDIESVLWLQYRLTGATRLRKSRGRRKARG